MFAFFFGEVPVWFCIILTLAAIYTTGVLVEAIHAGCMVAHSSVPAKAKPRVSKAVREPRHRAASLAENGDTTNPYSARAICARIEAELANATTERFRPVEVNA